MNCNNILLEFTYSSIKNPILKFMSSIYNEYMYSNCLKFLPKLGINVKIIPFYRHPSPRKERALSFAKL
jgi:hypothetical protein